MASPSQITKIHTLKSRLGIDDETYREILSNYNVKSSKDLSFEHAKTLLEGLENEASQIGVWTKRPLKYESLVRDDKMATPQQLRYIEGIWREICLIKNDKFSRKALRKILSNKFKTDDIMFIPKDKVNKVIHGLLAMKVNVIKKRSAATLKNKERIQKKEENYDNDNVNDGK